VQSVRGAGYALTLVTDRAASTVHPG
jgi:hypothetical protein